MDAQISSSTSSAQERGELRHFQLEKPGTNTCGLAFSEAAALLTVWSLLVINEGAIRLIDSNPAAGLSIGRPSAGVKFAGGLCELIFGLAGLFIGVAAFIPKAHSTALTKTAMGLQSVLGLFVFVVYVFVIPGFRAADLTEPSLAGLTVGQSRFLIALGAFTSFHFCLALQGGQFVFMARLVCAASGQDFLKQRSGVRMRAVFWNANMALAGLWTFATGMLVRINAGAPLDVPFMSPPNVGLLPGMTIWTGILMMFWAAVGVIIALSRSPVPKFYFPVIAYVYLSAFLNYTIVQFGLIEDARAGDVALRAGLVFMVVFVGPYFVQVAAREQERGAL